MNITHQLIECYTNVSFLSAVLIIKNKVTETPTLNYINRGDNSILEVEEDNFINMGDNSILEQ